MLLSAINLAYYQELMAGMRDAIEQGRFAEFRAQARAGLGQRRLAADIDLALLETYSAGGRRCALRS